MAIRFTLLLHTTQYEGCESIKTTRITRRKVWETLQGWLGSGRDREEEVWVLTGLERAAEVAGGGWSAGQEGAAE